MEGHGGLPSVADVQGKSLPLPPALRRGPPGLYLWLVPKPGGCICSAPTKSIPCAWLIPHLQSSPGRLHLTRKQGHPSQSPGSRISVSWVSLELGLQAAQGRGSLGPGV